MPSQSIDRLTDPKTFVFMRDHLGEQTPALIAHDGAGLSTSLRCAVADIDVDRLSVKDEPLERALPAVFELWIPPAFVPQTPKSVSLGDPTVFVGTGSIGDLHHERTNERLFTCLRGEIKCELYTPHYPEMHPHPFWSSKSGTSRVFTEQAETAGAHALPEPTLSLTIAPSESLYVPPWWWIHASAPCSSVLVTSVWQSIHRPPVSTRQGLYSRLAVLVDRARSTLRQVITP